MSIGQRGGAVRCSGRLESCVVEDSEVGCFAACWRQSCGLLPLMHVGMSVDRPAAESWEQASLWWSQTHTLAQGRWRWLKPG